MKKTMKYGAQKGSMNFFRRWLAKVASRELCLFPVPGPDVLRAYQSEPLYGKARLTANPREANVLLIIGDTNPGMAEQAAIVYAQMPRPRVLVLAGPKHLDPLPHPDVHVALEKDFLQTALPAVRECLSSLAWMDEPEPYQPEALVNKIEEAGQQQGHMHDHGGHDHSSHGAHDHAHEGHQHGGHEGHEHHHEEHAHSAHQHGNVEEGHNHDHHDHGHLSGHKKEGHDHSAHTHSAHEGHDHSHEDHKNHGHSHSGEAEAGESKGCHGATDKPGHDHGAHQHGEHGHEGHEHSGHQHGEHSAHQKHQHEGHDHSGHNHGAHQHGEHGHEGHQHKEHDHSQHEEHGHSHGGHEHSAHQHGDHGHGGHDHGSGFMSMIAMTKDLPRSTDGLPMEWSDVQFGPFHPGLPGGLRISMKLDGDTVAEAEADKELPSRNLLASIPEDPAELPEYLEAINPMAPVTYRLLAQKALANFSDEAGNSALTLSEAALLEKERITSHLNWLVVFASTLGSGWMRDQAIKHYHLFQNDTGNMEQLSGFIHRIKKMPYLKLKLSVAVHNPEETEKHNQGAVETHKEHHHEHNADSHSDHCHEEVDEQKPHDHGGHEDHEHHHKEHDHGEDHENNEGHGHSHEGHHHGDHDHSHETHQHSGHEGHEHHSGHETKEHHGDHDHHSHEMHQHGGHEHVHHDHGKDKKDHPSSTIHGWLPDDITGPVARAAGIHKDIRMQEAVYKRSGWSPSTASGNNAWSRLMVRLDEIEQSLRFIEKARNDSGRESSRKINIPSVGMGNGIAHIESPRGEVSLKLHIHEGKLANVQLTTPSAALVGLVKPVTEQQELADALVAVASLDILP
tara:strand:+ start:17803 stop:20340 length:2538 start_codon:yes stop_codon:yes gene_type:complete